MSSPQPRRPDRGSPLPTPPPALAERLGYLLKHAYLGYQSSQGKALAPLELDGRLLAVLTLLDAEGPALQQRLSERLQVDRTTMVALIDALERAGLVRRQRDPDDRRGQRVSTTTKGAKVLGRAHRAVRVAEQEFLDGLSDAEQLEFRRLLGALVRGARQLPTEPPLEAPRVESAEA